MTVWMIGVATSASPSGSPSPTPSPVPSEFPAGQFADNQLLVVVLGLLILMLAVLATPVVLSWQRPNFFETPFITWFLLHFGVGALALFALLALALAGSLTAPLIAIFSGLFGFIFGSTASRSAGQASIPKPLAVLRIQPPQAQKGELVAIFGQGFDPAPTVRLGEKPLTQVTVSNDGSMLTGFVGDGVATVDVVVQNANGAFVTLPKAFTYKAGPPEGPKSA